MKAIIKYILTFFTEWSIVRFMSKRKYSPEMQKRLEEFEKTKDETPNNKYDIPRDIFPNVALGMHTVVEGPATRYVVVEIPYDPETGEVGQVKVLTKDNNADATNYFKVAVDDQGFFTGVKKK